MTTIIRRVLLTFLLVLAPQLLTPPAQAVSLPTIVSPVAEETYPHGWAGPVQIDFTGAATGAYLIRVGCQEYAWQDTVTYDGSSPDYSAAIYPMLDTHPALCGIDVQHQPSGESVGFEFYAEGPKALTFDPIRVTPQVFYPTVRDGFRDHARLSFTAPMAGHAEVVLRSADGETVRSHHLSASHPGSTLALRWDGRDDDGHLVPPGTYHVDVEFLTAGGYGEFSRTVRVAEGWRTTRVTKSRPAIETTAVDRTRGCSVGEVPAQAAVRLRCWAGGHALARYAFHVPASATAVGHGMSGSVGCCRPGTVTRTAGRTSAHQYRVTVKATRERSYVARAVWVSYTIRQRV